MKRYVVSLVLFAVAVATPAPAQVSDQTKLTYEVLTDEFVSLVKNAMELDEAQWKAFEPVLEEYRAEVRPINQRRIALIREFVEKKGNLSEAEAEAQLATILDLERDQWLVERDFQKEFLKILPATKVLRFWQVQNRMMVMMMYNLAKDLPLAK